MYSRALKGRRDKMYLGWSWHVRESRRAEWRTAEKLLQGFEQGLREAKQEYADLWRITCHSQGGRHSPREVEAIIEALAKAKKQGKARFTGISTHDHPWLMMMIETFPKQIEVICTPYTASSKVLPKGSLFGVLKKHDCGAFGIKPFSSNSLFEGGGTPNDPHAEQDSRRARLAIRYIVENPGITAPIPGMINVEQVDNMATAIQERRQAAHLNPKELAELAMAGEQMWEKLPANYQWLKNWEYV
jgi:aryl-alcohol dehydrogenase-like predicted oxidoreductase